MFKFIIGYDWQGLYLNNELICENHKLDTYDILESISDYVKKTKIDINEDFFNMKTYDISQDWLEDRGNFPEKFEEIPKSVLYN